MKNWYSIKNMAEGVIDISLHDEIGLWGIQASDFIAELKTHGKAKAINLSIHSPGGNLLDGLAMYNALKAHPAKIHAHVDGLAASAASVVLMAGDTITMPEDAFVMIHNPYTGIIGDSDEMRAMADTLDKMRDSIVNIYTKRTGIDAMEVEAMMSNETWLSSADALDKGFIDTITGAVDVAAKISGFDKHFKNMPISNDNSAVEKIQNIKDFERYLRDAGGISKGVATALTNRAKAIFQSDSGDEQREELAEIQAALMRLKVPDSLIK